MDSQPLVSVTIPTKNSALKHSVRVLERCLQSIRSQEVPVEIVVADDASTDETTEIARSFGASVVDARPLLEQRYQGFKASTADLVVMLDSDQLLEENALSRCLEAMGDHDIVVLGERSVEGGGWVSRLYAADKRLLHARADYYADVKRANLLPRVYRRSVLEQAFAQIPERVRKTPLAPDLDIIFTAVASRTTSVGVVPDAVRHLEMDSLRELWRKYFRWGSMLPRLYGELPHLRALNRTQVVSRFRGRGPMRDHLQAYALVGLKSAPYVLGYVKGWLAWQVSSRLTSGRAERPSRRP